MIEAFQHFFRSFVGEFECQFNAQAHTHTHDADILISLCKTNKTKLKCSNRFIVWPKVRLPFRFQLEFSFLCSVANKLEWMQRHTKAKEREREWENYVLCVECLIGVSVRLVSRFFASFEPLVLVTWPTLSPYGWRVMNMSASMLLLLLS